MMNVCTYCKILNRVVPGNRVESYIQWNERRRRKKNKNVNEVDCRWMGDYACDESDITEEKKIRFASLKSKGSKSDSERNNTIYTLTAQESDWIEYLLAIWRIYSAQRLALIASGMTWLISRARSMRLWIGMDLPSRLIFYFNMTQSPFLSIHPVFSNVMEPYFYAK